MINELIKKYIEKIANGTYEDVYTILDDNCYVNGELLTKELLQDLKRLKNEIHYIDTSKLETDGINHKIIIKTAEEVIKQIIGIDK